MRWTPCLPLAVTLAAVPAVSFAQDADGDGVPDGLDLLPCNAAASALAYAPAQGVHGSILFEDLWPEDLTDLDFNDVHVTYNYEYRLDAQGRASSLRAVFNVLAIGGALDNGLGLHLPVPRGALASATRTLGGETRALLASTADAELTLQLSDNLREAFGGQDGQINSVPASAALPTQTLVVELTFATPVVLSSAGAPHDVYITRAGAPGHEIHRPEFAGTAAMNQSLFGTGADGSTAQRRFVDLDGLPYALVFPVVVQYPREAIEISALYPDIVAFAASGGASNANFYQSRVVASAAYAPVSGAAPVPALPAGAAVDRSCVPARRDTCRSVLLAGQSLGNGNYELDLDGTGPEAPFTAYCNMTTDGGGWTLVEWVASAYHSTTSATNPALLPNRSTHAKLSDAQIRTLALAGAREAMIDGSAASNTRYIFRYSQAEWQAFASNGWTNMTYDAKSSSGTWSNNVCNGHYNNRGFSSYSDAHSAACPVVFSGSARYITTWHTLNYAGGVGGAYGVYVR